MRLLQTRLARGVLLVLRMTGVAWGAIITLSIFVLSNIGALIYWSAKITTLLGVLQSQLEKLTNELHGMRESYVTKEQFAYRLSASDKEHTAIWKRLDAINGK